MGIDVNDLRTLIIKPCLEAIGDYSETAENLLAGTAAQESLAGQQSYCDQTEGLGIYQITAAKHVETWDKYLIQFPDLASRVRGFASQQQFLKHPHSELIGNLSYATVIAWMIYRANGVDTSKMAQVNNLAQLWATHFNNGTGCTRNIEDFIATYRATILAADNHKLVA
ncbi:MAG TPA: hypothetical protein VIM59_01615 [Cellvibrio sp.]